MWDYIEQSQARSQYLGSREVKIYNIFVFTPIDFYWPLFFHFSCQFSIFVFVFLTKIQLLIIGFMGVKLHPYKWCAIKSYVHTNQTVLQLWIQILVSPSLLRVLHIIDDFQTWYLIYREINRSYYSMRSTAVSIMLFELLFCVSRSSTCRMHKLDPAPQ